MDPMQSARQSPQQYTRWLRIYLTHMLKEEKSVEKKRQARHVERVATDSDYLDIVLYTPYAHPPSFSATTEKPKKWPNQMKLTSEINRHTHTALAALARAPHEIDFRSISVDGKGPVTGSCTRAISIAYKTLSAFEPHQTPIHTNDRK